MGVILEGHVDWEIGPERIMPCVLPEVRMSCWNVRSEKKSLLLFLVYATFVAAICYFTTPHLTKGPGGHISFGG